MDFDDRFDFQEFRHNIQALGLLDVEADIFDLLRRTTKNTRNGDAFSFKPTRIWIGSSSSSQLYSGFECAVDAKGPNPQKGEPSFGSSNEDSPTKDNELPSSFWIRFNTTGERFQFRLFCRGQTIPALRPYEGILPFRDVMPGGVELRAFKDGPRVTAQLTIRARRPPRVTTRLVPVLPGRDPIYDRSTTEADFYRDTYVNEADAGVLSPLGEPDRAIVKIGLWLTHRFQFSLTIRHYKLIWQCMIRLRLIKLSPDIHADIALSQPQLRLPNPHLPFPSSLSSFELRYLVEGLISYGTVSEAEVGSLHAVLQDYRPTRWPLILEALFKTTRTSSIRKDVEEVNGRIGVALHLPPHCIFIRRCLVTPTRCLLQPPQAETSNAMLRAFLDHHDRFLRVQFVDEDDALPVTSETLAIDKAMGRKKGIFARLRRTLRFGLQLAGRHYTFLCFGESQARERGCWMISEVDNFTVLGVLDWMGDLSEERNVAKHSARQGLALSTSRAVNLPIKVTYDLADITTISSGTEYTFTDGVGHCSQTLVNSCSSILGQDCRQVAPSAVQVRIGGSKGVLTVVTDAIIGADAARLRKSMVKFKSSNRTLNVIKVASYAVAYLNRQAILLLEAQGIPSDVLFQIFLDEKAQIEGLDKNFDGERLTYLTTFPLAGAISMGFTDDPLVQNVLRVLKCRLLSDLKWKARITIPDGAYLMGVADETRTLQEGEIFCQIDCPSTHHVITGTCTIYRNPCLHPGDVRLVNAVNRPELSHLKNVIIFPTFGARDLPSMMGGGDLDGDHYTLLWDKRLIIPREHEPMDYTRPPPRRVTRPITVDDTKHFFLDYIMNDILGMICNAHIALADQYDEGPSHDDCVHLAALASQAVDFSKTGIPVDRDSYTRPKQYPDFMGKLQEEKVAPIPWSAKTNTGVRTYKSQRVLGRMFRTIHPDPVFHPAELNDVWHHPFHYPYSVNWQAYLPHATLLKTAYDFELNGLLRAYNICEAECLAGVLLRSTNRRVRTERDYSLRVAVRDAFANIASSFTSAAVEHLTSHSVTGNEVTDKRAWALACYILAYEPSFSQLEADIELNLGQDVDETSSRYTEGEDEDEIQGGGPTAPERRYSFPWLFSEDIFLLAQEGMEV